MYFYTKLNKSETTKANVPEKFNPSKRMKTLEICFISESCNSNSN